MSGRCMTVLPTPQTNTRIGLGDSWCHWSESTACPSAVFQFQPSRACLPSCEQRASDYRDTTAMRPERHPPFGLFTGGRAYFGYVHAPVPVPSLLFSCSLLDPCPAEIGQVSRSGQRWFRYRRPSDIESSSRPRTSRERCLRAVGLSGDKESVLEW